MELKITGTEIADFVLGIQNRQKENIAINTDIFSRVIAKESCRAIHDSQPEGQLNYEDYKKILDKQLQLLIEVQEKVKEYEDKIKLSERIQQLAMRLALTYSPDKDKREQVSRPVTAYELL